LHLWLGDNIPQYTFTFCQLIIITTGLTIPVNILNSCIHATGKIRFLSLGIGSIYLLTLPLVYICFSLSFSPNYAYISYTAIMFIVIIATIMNAKHLIREISLTQYTKKAILPILIIAIISFFVPFFVRHFIEHEISRAITTLIIAVVTSTISILTIGLNQAERSQLRNYIYLKK
ncbi:MAG: hypothetical protein IKV32_01255, partial [Muribaculaceae bacterium]|nr:hypothetical protein [Muribaculaceae bacterium]